MSWRPDLNRSRALALLLLAASGLGPAAAQPLYPNGRTFNCDFQTANGGTGKAVLSFNITGTLTKQQGSMVEQIVGGQAVTRTIELTKPRWIGNKKVWDYAQGNGTRCTFSTWAQSVSFEGCSDGKRQLCRENTATVQQLSTADTRPPYLIIQEVMIKDDHEGLLRDDPEFEIYLVDPKPCDTGTCYEARPDTKLIFDGQARTDDQGRQLRLPDVNDTYRWYPLSTPIYLPYQIGLGLLGVEDDDTKGRLKKSNFEIEITCRPIDNSDPYFKASAPASLLPCWISDVKGIKSLWGGGDDEYKKMTVITHGLDQGRVDVIDAGEWALKVTLGY